MKREILLALTILMGLSTAAWGQTKLSLTDYLAQVKSQGTNYQAAQAQAEGYEKQSHQMDLTYSPQLLIGYNHLDDQSQQPSFLSTTRTLADTAGVSLVDKLPFGPSISVGYAFNDLNLTYSPQLIALAGSNASEAFISSYYQLSPVVSLSIPLVKDFGGAQTSAGVKAVQYGLESAQKLSAFQRDGVLFNAKVAYWGLALARAEVDIRKDTLDRNQKIWDWTKHRVARNLADPPDALQAEASVRQAELDLQTALNTERSARLNLNRYRNTATEEVPEQLEALEDSLAEEKVDIPAKIPERVDLQAIEDLTQEKKANYDQTYQNIYPDITAIASWRGNGLDPNFATANSTAFSTDHPTWMLGAQFNLSLDVFTAERTAEGYQKEYDSSILNLQDKRLAVDQEWRDIQDRLADVDKRLAMAAEIESLQKRNADEEKNQLALGRTTQFQLLSIENEYSLSRLSRLSLVAEKLGLLAQAQWWLSTDKGESK
jgi:outer membrane protein TolC